MGETNRQDALMRLGLLLQLQRRARQAGEQELPFIFVNETRLLTPYRQAVFWQADPAGDWKVRSVSGLAVPEPGAPFVQWLEALSKAVLQLPWHESGNLFSAKDLLGEIGVPWAEWLPSSGIWLPLFAKGRPTGALALFRDEPFSEQEKELLGHLAESYAQSLSVASPQAAFPGLRPFLKKRRAWLLAALFLALVFPVRQSVLAPAEIIPLRPAQIRAALDGIVESVEVAPNQTVSPRDILVRLEDSSLQTRLAVARKDLEMARAELQQAQQISLADPRAKIRLPMLQGRADQLTAEVALVEMRLSKVIIASPVAGVAVFDDPDVWLGRPVTTGQKILEVADPAQVQLNITLPMSETLPIKEGDSLLFFPNIRPHAPLEATLTFIGYQAAETPEAGIAFTLRAGFNPDEAMPRLGLRGTAKLYSGRMPLVLMLLRRPLLQVRQWLGF